MSDMTIPLVLLAIFGVIGFAALIGWLLQRPCPQCAAFCHERVDSPMGQFFCDEIRPCPWHDREGE